MNKQKTARQIYRFLNEEFFDGVLPEPFRFYFGKYKDCVAAWQEDGILFFSTYYHYDHVEIMLHEMCHVWQSITGGKDIHGKTFKEIALDISQRSGYDISKFQNYFSPEVLTNVYIPYYENSANLSR